MKGIKYGIEVITLDSDYRSRVSMWTKKAMWIFRNQNDIQYSLITN